MNDPKRAPGPRLLAGVFETPGWVWVGTSMVEPDDGT